MGVVIEGQGVYQSACGYWMYNGHSYGENRCSYWYYMHD